VASGWITPATKKALRHDTGDGAEGLSCIQEPHSSHQFKIETTPLARSILIRAEARLKEQKAITQRRIDRPSEPHQDIDLRI
jgi:hypothetical protein